MSGERDLGLLISSMSPVRRPDTFVFVSVPAATAAGIPAAATITEDEGVTLVVTKAEADARGWGYDFESAWLTLRVHSALDAVGLTAAVSSRLAEVGISCNVIAGYHHDHLLVPVDDASRAIDELNALAWQARSRQG
ncbi:ACT domain-containing protein [Rhodococcus oryzae]|uniref:ACT domain-containing protein n=1 Tax=Rhodococcus oryzae TaxID=2571143 RepID=A0ABY2RR20_9NOCA|nr:ACT domain-containing protein [Rhodococcus oryzae]TJZ81427.1 ACT domain-containing protein [Rhodococcus oryzae]